MGKSRDITVSLKIGTTIFILLLVLVALIAHSPAAPWHKLVRAVLAPGFLMANGLLTRLTGGSPADHGGAGIGGLFILASAANIAIYSAVVFFVGVILGRLRRDPVPARTEQAASYPGVFLRTVLRSIEIGFAIAILLVLATTLIKPGTLDWALAAADRICKILVGVPSHGTGGIYVLLLTVVNGLLISALTLIVQSCFIGLRHAFRG